MGYITVTAKATDDGASDSVTVTGEDDAESDNDDTDDGGYDTDVNTDPRNQKHIFELAQGAMYESESVVEEGLGARRSRSGDPMHSIQAI